jgi:hypothetical protein
LVKISKSSKFSFAKFRIFAKEPVEHNPDKPEPIHCRNSPELLLGGTGMLEYWNIWSKIGVGLFLKIKLSFIPIKNNPFIHHSIVPLL